MRKAAGRNEGPLRDPGAGTRRPRGRYETPPKTPTRKEARGQRCPPATPSALLLPQTSRRRSRSSAGAALQHPLTFARDAVRGSPIKNHPLEKRVVVDVLGRPGRGQAAALAALLLAEVGLVEDLAAPVPRLPEPAVPSCGAGGGGDTQTDQWRPPVTQTQHVRLAVTFTRLFPFICPVS